MESNQKPFGFTRPFVSSEPNKMHFEEGKETFSQKNIGSPRSKDKFDHQAQIHLSTEKIDPNSLSPLHIYLSVSGMIECGECGAEDSLQLKYDILSGRDWKLLAVDILN